MSDLQMTLVPPSDACARAVDVLARALERRPVPQRSPGAEGGQASPQEGLALVEGFLAVTEPELRQALLDIVAALAHRGA